MAFSVADVLRDEICREGIAGEFVVHTTASQHSAVIVSQDNGTRTTVWRRPPNADDACLERVPDVLEGADVVLFDSTDERLSHTVLDAATSLEIPTVLDTGSGRAWTDGLLVRTAHVIASEKYDRKLTDGLMTWTDAGGHAAGSKMVAVSEGGRGGRFRTRPGEGEQRWEALPVTALDTCGAGDTFHGAYAWAIAAGLPVDEALDVAAASAALKATCLGNAAIPSWDEVNAYLNLLPAPPSG